MIKEISDSDQTVENPARQFLPQIQSANNDLQEKIQSGATDARELDPENIDNSTEFYIEMDLGLGLLEAKNTEKPDEEYEQDIIIPGITNSKVMQKDLIQQIPPDNE
ncbi:MAG: hypothetical protein EZS28_014103 [Streblomastix strix]|uniref:Uncharacterized protein n=1 Tax=Streblomastix strix TaxID=222440 RepID=A0A5J4W678_9EUKA|nr:MAG: hypothetical protein EZS28_014103 [Streblomastix strix]